MADRHKRTPERAESMRLAQVRYRMKKLGYGGIQGEVTKKLKDPKITYDSQGRPMGQSYITLARQQYGPNYGKKPFSVLE